MGGSRLRADRMRLSGESARKAFSRRIHFRRREPDYVGCRWLVIGRIRRLEISSLIIAVLRASLEA